MGLYKLKVQNDDLRTGVLEKARAQDIEYERDFENWLENSPNALLDEEEGGGLIWIGRQITAAVGDTGKLPDLIGIDSSGDLVIVELKKGRTPRDIVAQILEYAAWGANLGYEDLNEIAQRYFKACDAQSEKTLLHACQEAFSPDAEHEPAMDFNRRQKLYLVAEDVSPVVRQVANHLRTRFGVNIHCVEYEVLKSAQGEYFISTERVVGLEDLPQKKNLPGAATPRWNKPVKVKDVISEAAQRITQGNHEVLFTPADILAEVVKEYPEMNPRTVRCQIFQDCVNHTSRKHYPSGQQDLYYRVDQGKYRLYNPELDGKWDWKGEKIE